MDGVAPDLGKLVSPGFINADPPGEPFFALTVAGSNYASQIAQAGGSVSVDQFGGINMVTPAPDAFIGIDSFGNVTMNSTTDATGQAGIVAQSTLTIASSAGEVAIRTEGIINGAGVVNITNAGTIAFDSLGNGALTNVQTINGAAYPPPGGGGGTSITQGGALVACLGNGAVTVSSIGAGVTVDITNAGTIAFDPVGPAAITGLSTITGANVYLYTSGGDLTMSADSGTVNLINNTGLQVSGEIKPSSDDSINLGIVGQAWAEVHATNGYFSTISNISSISAGTDYLSIYSGNTLTVESGDELHLKGGNIQVGTSGASTDIFLNGNTYIPSQELQVSSIVGVSSINGSAYPPPPPVLPDNITVATIDGLSTITGLASNTLFINSGSNLAIGSAVDVSGNVAPANADGVWDLGAVGNAWNNINGYNLNISSFNSSVIVGDNSITCNTVEAVTGLVLDGAASFTINGSAGAEGNVIAISSGYPAWVAPTGTVASGVILNDTIATALWDSVGTLGQYAFSFDIGITLNSEAVVQVATWNSDADEASTYWVVSCGLDGGLLRIVLAGNPAMVTVYNLSWVILSNGGTPP